MNVLKGICYVLGTIGLMVMALSQFIAAAAAINTAIVVEETSGACDGLFKNYNSNKRNSNGN